MAVARAGVDPRSGGSAAAPRRSAGRTAVQAGDPIGIGIAHRKVGGLPDRAVPVVALAVRATGNGAAARRGPDAANTMPVGRRSTSTDPSSSVRNTRAPIARSRSRVEPAGCPYGSPAPRHRRRYERVDGSPGCQRETAHRARANGSARTVSATRAGSRRHGHRSRPRTSRRLAARTRPQAHRRGDRPDRGRRGRG